MSSELQEALNAVGAAPLIQKVIDPLLLDYQRRFAPLVAATPTKKWTSNVYYFNTRTSRVPGGFVSDGGARPVGASAYTQNQFNIRLLQSVGSVTGFTQEVTRDLMGDLQAEEIEAAAQGLIWDIETGMGWGCDAATANGPYPQFDGYDKQVGNFSAGAAGPQNAVDAAGSALSLGWLDVLIDLVQANAAQPALGTDWMFVMSSTADSKIAQLLTNQQRFSNIPTAEVAAGLIVPTYRNIPIVLSSFTGQVAVTPPTVTTATATTGGTLAAATYYYRVSFVMSRLGEVDATTEVSQTTTGSTSTVTLSFTPPSYSNETGVTPQLIKVYRSTSTGTETLLGYVDANVGLQGDGVTPIVTTSIIDTGATLIPQNGSTIPAVYPTAYVGTNSGHLPRTTGEDIYLVSRNPNFVCRPYVRDIRPIPVYPTTTAPDTLPFALVSDTTLAVRAPKYGSRLRNVVATLSH